MRKTLPNPLYYLDNFRHLLAWVGTRYDDLLLADERQLITHIPELPPASQALLVRMVMRKGPHFRANKLVYDEVGDVAAAATPLLALGWLDAAPALTLAELFGLCTRGELAAMFAIRGNMTKAELLAQLQDRHTDARTFCDWHPQSDETVYALRIADCCDRLRLMYFGNLHQDWSEFVLAELGVYQYEKVAFSAASRGFQTRRDIDDYLLLFRCRERLYTEPADVTVLDEIAAAISRTPYVNPWIEQRRGRLLYQLGREYERLQQWDAAEQAYAASCEPDACVRSVRVLELSGRHADAHAAADALFAATCDAAQQQQLARMLPRLCRRVGKPAPVAGTALPVPELRLCLPAPDDDVSVEMVVRDHLHADDAPAWYVENTLFNSLFGLLCWDAVFAAIPGAFFHPYQSGPADLSAADFHARRRRQFEACLAQLSSGSYRDTILRHYAEKSGLLSPFVFWGALSEELLAHALDCLPASHLQAIFVRMLADIRNNCAGLPDLIQFWPREARYEMTEVKGPGDRLQDNQKRWLQYCIAHGMPVRVCYVDWREALA